MGSAPSWQSSAAGWLSAVTVHHSMGNGGEGRGGEGRGGDEGRRWEGGHLTLHSYILV